MASSKSPSRSKKSSAAAPKAASGTGIELIDQHVWVILIPFLLAGIILTNGNDPKSVLTCGNFYKFANGGRDGDNVAGITKAFWPYGLIVTGHVFSKVVTGGNFVNNFTRTLLAAFGGGMVMAFLNGDGLKLCEKDMFLCAFAWWFSTSKWSAMITDQIPGAVKSAFADYHELCSVFFCTSALVAACKATGDGSNIDPSFGQVDNLNLFNVNFKAQAMAVLTAMAYEGFPFKNFSFDLNPANYKSVFAATCTALFITGKFAGFLAPVNGVIDTAITTSCLGSRAQAAFWFNVIAFAYNKYGGDSCPWAKFLGSPIQFIEEGIDFVLGLN